MKLYVSRINYFTNKEGIQKCALEGIRYKKEDNEFKGEYKKIYLSNYPVTWHTDIIKIPFTVEIKFNQDTRLYEIKD